VDPEMLTVGTAALATYMAQMFLGVGELAREKMITSVNEHIVAELERAGQTLRTDHDGDVTLEYVMKSIEDLGTRYRREQADNRYQRRMYNKENLLRMRAEAKVKELNTRVEDLQVRFDVLESEILLRREKTKKKK
jgi:hypothetical protein